VLCHRLAGASVKAAAQSVVAPLALETFYHVLSRLRQRLDALRCCLCGRQRAPDSSQADPLLQTIEHLQAVFAGTPCPVSEFQFSFQQPFLG